MIRFVLYDDNKGYIKKYSNVINKVMMGNDTNYRIDSFTTYDEDFQLLIQDNSTKIYILDIEIPHGKSGIDVAKLIRTRDWDSLIIMVTSHSELGYEALKAQIMLLDFICKYNDFENDLRLILNKAINKIDDKKILTFSSNNTLFRIFMDDILYVYKDTVDRKCVIKTTFSEFSVNMTLNEMLNKLDNRFYMCHRSCTVNTERIKFIDWKEPCIIFDTEDKCTLISRDKKKGLKNYVVVD